MPSSIRLDTFNSQALQDNPLGDTASRTLPIYLPPGYSEGDARYPVVYLLVGYAGRGLKLMNDSFWEETMQQRMDRLIAEGAAKPMILVMPDASTRYGGAQYLNTSAQGNYKDYILEIVEYIDQNYRSQARREQRAIAGFSSGGMAALHFGMQHPDTFGLVASHSSDAYFELTYKPDIPKFCRFYEKAGAEGLYQLLQDPKKGIREGTSFYALMMAAMAACYSPNPASPFGFDLPFNPRTGELHPEVWQRWLAFDPVEMVAEHAAALRSLELLFFDCGLYDEYNLLYGARILAERLDQHHIPYHYEEYEDGHRNTEYRYETSLKQISEVFNKLT